MSEQGPFVVPDIGDDLFRLLLDCLMQADPHPWSDNDDSDLRWHLDTESQRRGFGVGPGCWFDAYHRMPYGYAEADNSREVHP
jgi:hypothetical protein